MGSRVLVLSSQDIQRSVRVADLVPVVQDAYRAFSRGEAELSPKFHWEFSVGRSAAFASVVPSWGMMATKVGSVRPSNVPAGLPSGIFQVVLHDARTGQPLAILDGKSITTLRTGAAAAAGAQTLARADSRTVALIGPGVVGRASLEALSSLFDLERAYIIGIDAEESSRFAAAAQPGFPFTLVPAAAEEGVRGADIIITVTPSTQPVVLDEWVRDGTHISAIGSDWKGKRELETATLLRSGLIADSRVQCLEIGEGNVPRAAGELDELDIRAEIGEVLTGTATGRQDAGEVTVFDSSGIAIQDLAAARLVYEAAVAAGTGIWVEL